MNGKNGAVSARQGAKLSSCWCGETAGTDSRHPAYVVCPACGTARLRDVAARGQGVVNGETGIYSADYWGRHQEEDLGLPSIEERAVNDLPERCMHWLSLLLHHVLPPACVLDIGCGHGGFVKLCKMAGFQSTGIEMAAEIVRFAQDAFGVEVRRGPLADLDLHFGAQHLGVCMFDVLEHLPDPLAQVQDLLQRGTGRVTLIVQTPEFTDSMSDSMFAVPEHINLFTRRAVSEMLGRAGFAHVEFAESCFQDDVTAVASNMPIRQNTEAAVAEALLATGDGRVLNATRTLAARLGQVKARNHLIEDGDGLGISWSFRQLLRGLRRRLFPH